MTAAPAPFIAPSRNKAAWETLVAVYAGLEWKAPGVVKISNAVIEIAYDVKEAQAQKGASTERKGQKVQKFTSTHWLSDEPWLPGTFTPIPGVVVEDHVQWTAFQWVLEQSKDADPPIALSLRHPELQRQKIKSAVVTKIGGATPNDDGSTVIAVDWLVYAPVKKTGGAGVKDTPEGKTETDDAIDKAIAEIDKLQEEYEQL
jgi:hypothetical protein